MLVLVFTLILSLLLVFPVSSQYTPGVGLPQTSGSPWLSSNFATAFEIASSTFPSLNGFIGYTPFVASPSVRSPVPLSVRVLLPHSQDNNGLGCNPFRFNYTDDGTSLVGAAVVLLRGGCPFQTKQRNIAAISPALFILADIATSPRINNLPFLALGDTSFSSSFPSISVNTADGAKLIRNLVFNMTGDNRVPNIVATIKPSGTVSPAVKAALTSIFGSSNFPAYSQATWNAGARSWTDIGNPNLDPCYDRVYGFWCEDGKLVRLDMGNGAFSWAGAVPASIATLTDLKFIDWSVGGLTSIPSEFCSLTNLAYLNVNSNPNLNSFPDCYNQLPLVFLALDGCAIRGTISTLPQSPNLVWVSFKGSQLLGSLPSNWSSPNLEYLDLSASRVNGGGLTGALPDFSGLSSLRYLDISNNYFSTPSIALPTSCFNNLGQLQVLHAANNLLSMNLPSFQGTTRLSSLDLSNNNLIGQAFPSSWTSNLLQVTSVKLSANKLISPFTGFGTLNSLVTLDLSNNSLSISGPITVANNAIALATGAAGSALTSIDLSYNSLAGDSFPGSITNRPSLQKIVLSNNFLTSLPSDLFSASTLVYFDVANNSLSGALPSGIPPGRMTYLDVSGNARLFSSNGNLPAWISQNLKTVFRSGSSLFFCPNLSPVQPANPSLFIGLDSTYYGYKNCICLAGYYGNAPNCYRIPSSTDVSSTPVISPLRRLVANETELPLSSIGSLTFSDAWYGSQRALQGLDSVWTIDFSGSAIIMNGPNKTYKGVSSLSLSERSTALSPVVTLMHFFFDLSLFSTSTDQLYIFEGQSLDSDPVAVLKGGQNGIEMISNSSPLISLLPEISQSAVRLFSRIGYFQVFALSTTVSVNYRSRDPAGVHFIGFAAADSVCPSGYSLNGVSCVKDRSEFAISNSLLNAIIGLSVAVCGLILLTALYLIKHHDTSLVRAASRPFTTFMILCLLFMCGTSILYAIVPSYSGGDRLCKARLWCSCLSLMGILGVLVAKSFRVSVIFGSKVLLQIRAVTDGYVALIVGCLLVTQFIMLIIFEAMDMTWASKLSKGSNQYVWGCDTGNGFAVWMGVQIAIFASVMIAGAVVAFKTRSVPSAFNESQHILFTLQILLFFLIMIVPLDWALVNDAPEAAVVFQGGGSLVLSFFILLSNFVPKVFLLFKGRGNDKSLVFQSVGKTVSSSAVSMSSVSEGSLHSSDGSHSSQTRSTV